jgi:hypothetical protein
MECIYVIWGGANDVVKNNTKEGLRHVSNFVRTNNHTNIVLLCLPYGHDLTDWSCVNKEITVFNRKILKIMKCYEHVTIIQHDLSRDMFTQHGLHLNALGKEVIVKYIAATYDSMFQKSVVPICLFWKDNFSPSDNCVTDKYLVSDHSIEDNNEDGNETIQKSNRLRKPPIMKNEDFLWSTKTKNAMIELIVIIYLQYLDL